MEAIQNVLDKLYVAVEKKTQLYNLELHTMMGYITCTLYDLEFKEFIITT